MPLNPVRVAVVRTLRIHLGGGEYGEAETQIPGSPFLARVYRAPQSTVATDEAQDGTTTLDEMQRLSVMDPACPIQVGDKAYLPLPGGAFQPAKIMRPRRYADRIQYDLETGAEGSATAPAGSALTFLPPAPSVQSQIDALSQQIQDLTTMSQHLAKLGTYAPSATISASTTLTKPAQSTTYPVDTTTGAVVITLYASTGDGTDLEFVRTAGTNPVTFVLASGDTCPLPLGNCALNNIGEVQSFREMPGHIMEAH